MKRFLKDYRLNEHTEALFLLTLGIVIQVLDGSPMDVSSRWKIAWDTEFPREYFSAFTQKIIKTILSAIILVRCLTSVVYILSGVIVVYCVIKETSPKLMLPWLFISGLKSVLLTFLETLTGVYVCSAFGKVRKPCLEFVASKAVELFFAIYLWACIRSIHKDLELFEEDYRDEELLTNMVLHKVNLRMHRSRSMIDETTLCKTANLNYFELKDVPNIIFDMLKTEGELSQDSLLSPGMMLASVSNMGSYDYLKTSLSLGELGTLDLSSYQVVGLDDERNLSASARAMKFLKVTKADIQKAKNRREDRLFPDNYSASEEITHFLDNKPSSVFLRSSRREEVFIANIPDLSNLREDMKKKNNKAKPHDDILCDTHDFEVFSEEGSRASAEEFMALEEGDEDEEEPTYIPKKDVDGDASPDLWFMTNRKDEVTRLSIFEAHYARRSDNYERLYQQDFMSVIGPGVFDKASKLAKLTSLSDVNAQFSIPISTNNLVYPSTSTAQESVEQEETTKSSKMKKKIAFIQDQDHYDRHTTMPVSIIVTNFPIRFDSQISNSEGIYYRERSSSSAEIVLLPDRRLGLGERDTKKGPATNERTRCLIDQASGKSEENIDYNVDVYSSRDRCERRSEVLCNLQAKELTVYTDYDQKLPEVISPDENDYVDVTYPYPRPSEQLLFIKDLMRMPIRDVLKSYYELKKLDKHYSKKVSVRRTYSNDSRSPFRYMGKKKIPWKTDTPKNSPVSNSPSPAREQLSQTFPSVRAGSQAMADGETQVHFTEDGLRSYHSTETIILGTPITDKLQTDGNQSLPPLYLFGNRDQGWSSTPWEMIEKSNQQCKVKSKSHTVTKSTVNMAPEKFRGMNTSYSFSERSVIRESIGQKAEAGSDSSLKLVLSPRQESTDRNESFSSAQDNISEVVPVPLQGENQSICSAESDESFSLFYSKTADLTSPLLDVSRFIYPDHIHYSYKNVNKKGFDVELNGGLPLLMRDSLTLRPPMTVKLDTPPDTETGITRRPMDLTFAYSDAFKMNAETETSTSNLDEPKQVGTVSHVINNVNYRLRRHVPRDLSLKKEQKWMRKFTREDKARNPDVGYGFELDGTSSMHLHSNKGRDSIVTNPLFILQNGKLRQQQKRVRLKSVGECF